MLLLNFIKGAEILFAKNSAIIRTRIKTRSRNSQEKRFQINSNDKGSLMMTSLEVGEIYAFQFMLFGKVTLTL